MINNSKVKTLRSLCNLFRSIFQREIIKNCSTKSSSNMILLLLEIHHKRPTDVVINYGTIRYTCNNNQSRNQYTHNIIINISKPNFSNWLLGGLCAYVLKNFLSCFYIS